MQNMSSKVLQHQEPTTRYNPSPERSARPSRGNHIRVEARRSASRVQLDLGHRLLRIGPIRLFAQLELGPELLIVVIGLLSAEDMSQLRRDIPKSEIPSTLHEL